MGSKEAGSTSSRDGIEPHVSPWGHLETEGHARLDAAMLGVDSTEPSMKFKKEGGRAGSITFGEGEASGQLDWEMLSGDIPMVIYPASCVWLAPHEARLHPDDVRRLAQEFAIERNFAVEIALPRGAKSCGRVPQRS